MVETLLELTNRADQLIVITSILTQACAMLESLKQNDGRKVYSFSGMLGMKYIYRNPLIIKVGMNRSKINNNRKIDVIAVKKN